MEKILNENFGCQIIKRDEKIFIRFDGGHFAVKIEELEINEELAKEAMESEKGAYKVIIFAQTGHFPSNEVLNYSFPPQ